jgi:hypothetical protein
MHFGFVEVAELLGRRGAKRDLRFAAGLGELDVVKSWFDADGSLKPGAGALAVWTGAQAARAIAVPL